MSQREQARLLVLSALDRGELIMAAAATLVGLSVRHLRRLRRAYRRRGAAALAHGNRGRPSPRRLADAVRQRILRLARTRYAEVNHSHFTELLAEREGLRKQLTTSEVQPISARGHRRVRPVGPGSLDALRWQRRRTTGLIRVPGTPPPRDHPWRLEARVGKLLKDLKEAEGTFSLKR